MKTKIAQIVIVMLIATLPVMAQTTDRKAEKEKKRMAREKEISALVDSRIFEFKATRAIPTGYRSVDLTTNPNFVRFSPELVVSQMPYFGRAYSASYGGDGGLKFEGKPEIYKVEKNKKNYSVEVKVKGTDDYYTINLTISFEGSSSMSIGSNKRALISYNGEIYTAETASEKK